MSTVMEWLKSKVTKNLSATESAFEDLMDQEGSMPGSTNRKLLDFFLGRDDQNEKLLLFYATEHHAVDGRLSTRAF